MGETFFDSGWLCIIYLCICFEALVVFGRDLKDQGRYRCVGSFRFSSGLLAWFVNICCAFVLAKCFPRLFCFDLHSFTKRSCSSLQLALRPVVTTASAPRPHTSCKRTRRRRESEEKDKKYLQQDSLTFNLNIRAQRQLLHSHTRPRGLDLAPVRLVSIVHGREVLHVGEEDIDLEDGGEAAAGGGEDRGQVADALVLGGRRVRARRYVRFDLRKLTVRSATVPGTILPVLGSMPTAPEQ